MEANKIRLLEFLGTTKKTFNIPVYQRNYDWREEHCKKLFTDIEKIALNNFKINHFIGTVVYVLSYAHLTYQELVLIDGQQRVTSITLLIKAIYDVIEDPELKEDILETYLINRKAPESLRVKLKPVESDAIPYKNIIENSEMDIESNICRNYKLFKQLISQSQVSPEDLYNAMNNVELVYIQLDKDKPSENPQMIFESLNSTGLSLTQGDLIRNFLLMNNTYEEQTRLYREYWLKIEKLVSNEAISDYVRDYLTMKMGSIPNKDKVYSQFKEFAQNPDMNMDEEGMLEDLLLYANYYSWFLTCNSPYEDINDSLSELQQLKSTTVYPLLLYMFEDCMEYSKIGVDELNKILRLILSYLYRRIICGYPTHALNKIFASFIGALENSKQVGYYAKVAEILMEKTSSGAFPRNDEFRSEFIKKDLYKTKIDKYTLYRLESYKSKERIMLSDDITVEHIMPQKLTPAWKIELGNKYEEIYMEYLHTVGNLTLTGYNSNLSNKCFTEKKELLKTSNFAITRGIGEYETWGKENIILRANELYCVAEQLWNIPVEFDKKNIGHAVDYTTTYNIMDDINVTGEKPRQLIFMDSIYVVNSWKDLFRKVCDLLYELDDDMMKRFTLHTDFCGRGRRIIADNLEGMISPYKICEGVYAETNFNANALINYCRIMAGHYEIQDDISFVMRR